MAYNIFRLVRKPGFVVRKVGEAFMVVPVGPRMKDYKGVITINKTGAFIFELMKEEKPFNVLVKAVMDEYEIEEETAKTAVTAFIYQCQDGGLLESQTVEEVPEGEYMMSPELSEQINEESREKMKAAYEQAMAEKAAKEAEGIPDEA